MLKRMFIMVISFFLFCSLASAVEIGFIWDANTENDLAGYRLYQSRVSGVYVKGADNAVDFCLAPVKTLSVLVSREGKYYWVVTAFDDQGNESGFSNEVSKTLDFTPPSIPKGLTINITVEIRGE